MATAEADAEAFGEFALAEVDAYTYVSEGDRVNGSTTEGQIDILGNTIPFAPAAPGDDFIIPFNEAGVDVDDVNGFGALEPLSGTPAPPADTPIPDAFLTITDLSLTGGLLDDDIPGLYEYTSANEFVVDFGARVVDLNDNGTADTGESGDLLLRVPAGTTFIAEFTAGGGLEVAEEELTAGDAEFVFTPEGSAPIVVPTELRFVFQAETLGVAADWALEAIGNFPGPGDVTPGEAFAYAESTSAVDLNGDGI